METSEPWLSPASLVSVAMKRQVDDASEVRVQTRGQMSHGIWDPQRSEVRVTQARGKYWQVMGHQIQGQTYLYPEEALFLLEIQQLEILDGEVPMSVQKAFTLMLMDSQMALNYRVYSHLTRLGYKLVRHHLSSKRRRDQDQETGNKAAKRAKTKAESNRKEVVSISVADKELLPCGTWPSQMSYEVSFRKSKWDGVDPEPADSRDMSNISSWSEWKKASSNFGPVNLPSMKEVRVCDNDRVFSRGFYPLNFWSNPQSENRFEGHAEMIEKNETRLPHATRLPVELNILWAGPVKPLIPPQSVQSTRDVLKLIQIPDIKCETMTQRDQRSVSDLKIDFDIYMPNVSFKKSNPTLPNFRMAVTSSDENVLKTKCIQDLKKSSPDSVPLLLGVVGSGSISFFGLYDISLPTIITIG